MRQKLIAHCERISGDVESHLVVVVEPLEETSPFVRGVENRKCFFFEFYVATCRRARTGTKCAGLSVCQPSPGIVASVVLSRISIHLAIQQLQPVYVASNRAISPR